ncbi:MAG: alpha/beta fold hydrolase [Candidatus Rokuibacteriota bacterium]
MVIHSYRHRYRNAPGEPRLDAIERRLAERPRLEVPSAILHGRDDGVDPPARSETHPALFPAGTERRVIPDAGHFLPREQPAAVVDALLSLLARTAR